MVDFEADIRAAVTVLESGGVIIYPTDTVWGIGCDATNENAVNKVYEIKGRAKEKSMIILLAEERDIIQYVASPPPDIIDIVGHFDKPTTVIYEHALGLAENAVNENGSIAIRVTADPFCKALIKRLKKPIVSTSANFTGNPTPPTYQEINPKLLEMVDYVVKYRQDDENVRPPSRIIRINDDGTEEIVRP
jgi:L-threonylcarbamoyladenylate synthase